MGVNHERLAQLKTLEQRDIDTRTQPLQAGRLYHTYDEAMRRVHAENARALDELRLRRERPGISKVGIPVPVGITAQSHERLVLQFDG